MLAALILASGPGMATPVDVRVFLVDPVAVASLPSAEQNDWLDKLRKDITNLSQNGSNKPRLGWFLLTRSPRSTEPYLYEWVSATDPAAGTKAMRALDTAIGEAKAKRITGSMELTELRKKLMELLRRTYLGDSHLLVAMHVFSAEWRTASIPVSRLSSSGADTSERPSECFVGDLGVLGGLNNPWPENRKVQVELRPPPGPPTPSEEALGTMIAVLIGQAKPETFGESLGIAGPLCPPGTVRQLALIPMDDPEQCKTKQFDSSQSRRIAPCQAAVPFLAAQGSGLVRRPVNLVMVDGDGGASGVQIDTGAAPAGLTLAHDIGGVALGASPVPSLSAILLPGSRGMLRAVLSGGGCTAAGPLREQIVLNGTRAQTLVQLATAPVPCTAWPNAPDLSFDLLTVRVE